MPSFPQGWAFFYLKIQSKSYLIDNKNISPICSITKQKVNCVGMILAKKNPNFQRKLGFFAKIWSKSINSAEEY